MISTTGSACSASSDSMKSITSYMSGTVAGAGAVRGAGLRIALRMAHQNRCSFCWSRSTDTNATRRCFAEWSIHARNSEVLPLPGGAEMTVRGLVTARSSNWRRSLRSSRPRVPETSCATGYGAMQLAGPGVLGPPRDRAAAVEVLRTAVELGVNHIDTADAYGPYITNEIIREALFPYGDDVHIVTKVGVVRDERGGWLPGNSPESLRAQVHDNLRRLGLDVLDVVNLRTLAGIDDRATVPGELARQFEALAELQQQGLIRHLGLSTVSLDQLAEAQRIVPVVCVQNFYNIANRADAAVLAATASQDIAYVPYFPLGGFSPLQSDVLESVAKRLGATPIAVAESWLLLRSPNVMLIPGTSSVDHLRENIAGAALALPPDAVAELDAI